MLEMFKTNAKKIHERVMAYEPLESEPDEVEAVARPSKQSTELDSLDPRMKIPEGQFTLSELARGSGMSRYKAGQALKVLLDKGVVETLKSGKRKVYQIIGQSSSLSKVTPKVPDGSETDDIDFVKITSELIFSFIRETRSTDVLLYLTWLERQGGQNE